MVVERDDARVGDGDAEYVSCEIAQHGVVTLPPMVDVDDPGLGPGGSGDDQVWALVGEHGFEFAAHQLGQGHVRDEKSFAGRIPVAAVIGDSTAGDEAMNVRMVDELLGPGVEDGEHSEQLFNSRSVYDPYPARVE